MTIKANKGLGRGLDVLLMGNKTAGDRVSQVLLTQLRAGKYQPRSQMDEAALSELAGSIKTQGVLQPILVREIAAGQYEIIAGERRWRAAQLAGLTEVPVLIKSVADADALTMAIIENIQRENLNPLEEAQGLQRLIDEFSMTHQAAADAVGRSRSAASNLLRLLKLPLEVQNWLMQSQLDMGHARALLSLSEAQQQIELAQRVMQQGLSVRETEQLVQQLSATETEKPVARPSKPDTFQQQVQLAASNQLGTAVEIKPSRSGAGRLVIRFKNTGHLEALLQKLCGDDFMGASEEGRQNLDNSLIDKGN